MGLRRSSIALVATAVALFAVFLWQEQRAPEPVLPLRIVRDPVMRMCVGVNFTSGMLLWCGIFFVPLFVQEVRGVTPTRAGLRAHAADVRRPRSARSCRAGGSSGPVATGSGR